MRLVVAANDDVLRTLVEHGFDRRDLTLDQRRVGCLAELAGLDRDRRSDLGGELVERLVGVEDEAQRERVGEHEVIVDDGIDELRQLARGEGAAVERDEWELGARHRLAALASPRDGISSCVPGPIAVGSSMPFISASTRHRFGSPSSR